MTIIVKTDLDKSFREHPLYQLCTDFLKIVILWRFFSQYAPNYTSFRPTKQGSTLGRGDVLFGKERSRGRRAGGRGEIKDLGADSRTFSCSERVDFECSGISSKRQKGAGAPIGKSLSPTLNPTFERQSRRAGGGAEGTRENSWASISEKKKIRHSEQTSVNRVSTVSPHRHAWGESTFIPKERIRDDPLVVRSAQADEAKTKGTLRPRRPDPKPSRVQSTWCAGPSSAESHLEEILKGNASSRPHGGAIQRLLPSAGPGSPLKFSDW